jgi:hypothetical protein
LIVQSAVDAAYATTQTLDTIISENNDLILQLQELRQYLVNIDNDVQVLDTQQEALITSTNDITATLNGMVDEIEDAANGIDDLVVQVNDITDFVATAPDYLGCKWIGNVRAPVCETMWTERAFA